MSPRIPATINNPHITKTFRLVSGFAIIAPAANKRESPGRNGVTTRPVSAKIIRNRIK
jgi:hypothetical protein